MKKVFVPRYPDREDDFPGIHVSQIMHPLHALEASAWKELRRNVYGSNYTTAQVYNEIFGESYDSADRMISQPELQAACSLGPNTIQEALSRRGKMDITCVGIDWTGGGDGSSLTKLVFGGIPHNSSEVHVLYMEQLPKSMPIQEQLPEVMRLIERLDPDIVAHDYTGHGWLFEAFGLSRGLSRNSICPFEYGISAGHEVIYPHESGTGLRRSLHLDHTRSLFALFSMIKAGRVKFPDWNGQKDKDTGTLPVNDFMHMFAESRRGFAGDLLCVKKDHGQSDDFVHATNFMASACWYRAGSYPSVPSRGPSGASTVASPEDVAEAEGDWQQYDEDDAPQVV